MQKRHHVYSVLAKCMLIIASVLLVGCANKEAAVIERYKAPGLAQLKRLQGVAELMRDRPALVADAESLPLDGVSFMAGESYMTGEKLLPTGAFVDAEMLTEDGLRKVLFDLPLTVESLPFWGHCGAYLTTGKDSNGSPPKGDKDIEVNFKKFLKVKFLGVARTVELRLPKVTGEAQFSSGRYRFDLFLFELADPPQYLGGIRVDATNSPNLEVKYREDMREEATNRTLINNLNYRDSTGLGFLAGSQKVAQTAGASIVLTALNEHVKKVLETAKLVPFFIVAANEDEALAKLKALPDSAPETAPAAAPSEADPAAPPVKSPRGRKRAPAPDSPEKQDS